MFVTYRAMLFCNGITISTLLVNKTAETELIKSKLKKKKGKKRGLRKGNLSIF